MSQLVQSGQFPHVTHKRGALTESPFGKQVAALRLGDVAYSTAFYWADLVFDTSDTRELLDRGYIVIQERYDLSVVAYRRMHSLDHDELLQRAYLDRGMLMAPDLTVFLDPSKDKVLERIRSSPDSSSVDRALLSSPESIDIFQASLREQLEQLGRMHITLDTSVLGMEQCVAQITHQLAIIHGGERG